MVALTSPEDVRVQIFTVAFRMVQNNDFKDVQAGGILQIPLEDRWGNPLANGLYYVVVTTKAGRTIGKLLVIR
jgi:hypothetical protein